jgi:hypothetical protein
MASEATMKEHCRTQHRWIKKPGQFWVLANVQTLYGSKLRHTFEVTVVAADQEEEEEERTSQELLAASYLFPPSPLLEEAGDENSTEKDYEPPKAWPSHGALDIQDLCVTYK